MTNATPSPETKDAVRPQLRVVSRAPDTDGETPIGSSDQPDGTAEAPTRDSRPRTRASIGPEAPTTKRDQRGGGLRDRVASWVRPPDVWSADRPSLRKQLNYARWGQQHPASGPLRWLSIAVCCLGLLPQGIAYYVAWAAERPGRLLSIYVLLAVVLKIPAVRAAATALVAVFTAPLTWL